MPASEIIGLQPGEVFVHRNVANIISLTDFNCLATVQYAVDILKVVHIIVCGHYGCGGVQAALGGAAVGLVNNWLSPISEAFETYREQIEAIDDPVRRVEKLCEINVILQVRNLCRSALVRDAWTSRRELAVHGANYGLQYGILRALQRTCQPCHRKHLSHRAQPDSGDARPHGFLRRRMSSFRASGERGIREARRWRTRSRLRWDLLFSSEYLPS